MPFEKIAWYYLFSRNYTGYLENIVLRGGDIIYV